MQDSHLESQKDPDDLQADLSLQRVAGTHSPELQADSSKAHLPGPLMILSWNMPLGSEQNKNHTVVPIQGEMLRFLAWVPASTAAKTKVLIPNENTILCPQSEHSCSAS